MESGLAKQYPAPEKRVGIAHAPDQSQSFLKLVLADEALVIAGTACVVLFENLQAA
jgi:hypothetical protein